MKPLIVSFLLVCSFTTLSAETTTSNPLRTVFETFLDQPETVVIKSHSDIGSVTGKSQSKIDIRAFAASAKGVTKYALLVEDQGSNHYFVDFDEITSLLSGIDALIKSDKSVSKLDSFSVRYTTRSGLQFTRVDYDNQNRGQTITIGPDNGYQIFELDELNKIKDLIQKGQTTLQSLQK